MDATGRRCQRAQTAVVDEDRRFHGAISENKLLGLVMPSREAAQRAREVLASLANIAGTFEGRSVTGPLSDEEQNYALVVAAMDAGTFAGLKLRNIGPALMAGRISDIAVDPSDRSVWYVAVGSGGVWKTLPELEHAWNAPES